MGRPMPRTGCGSGSHTHSAHTQRTHTLRRKAHTHTRSSGAGPRMHAHHSMHARPCLANAKGQLPNAFHPQNSPMHSSIMPVPVTAPHACTCNRPHVHSDCGSRSRARGSHPQTDWGADARERTHCEHQPSSSLSLTYVSRKACTHAPAIVAHTDAHVAAQVIGFRRSYPKP
jgi:hypothetical protein